MKLSHLRWWIQSFPIFDFPLKAQIFSLATNTISCFPWSDRLMLFIFEKMSARYPNLNNHTLFIIHPSKNGVSWKRHLVQLSNNHTSAFPWDSHNTSICSRRALHLLSLLYRMLEECVSGLRFNKINKWILRYSYVKLVFFLPASVWLLGQLCQEKANHVLLFL